MVEGDTFHEECTAFTSETPIVHYPSALNPRRDVGPAHKHPRNQPVPRMTLLRLASHTLSLVGFLRNPFSHKP